MAHAQTAVCQCACCNQSPIGLMDTARGRYVYLDVTIKIAIRW